MSIGGTGRKRGSSGKPNRFAKPVLYNAQRPPDDPEFGSVESRVEIAEYPDSSVN